MGCLGCEACGAGLWCGGVCNGGGREEGGLKCGPVPRSRQTNLHARSPHSVHTHAHPATQAPATDNGPKASLSRFLLQPTLPAAICISLRSFCSHSQPLMHAPYSHTRPGTITTHSIPRYTSPTDHPTQPAMLTEEQEILAGLEEELGCLSSGAPSPLGGPSLSSSQPLNHAHHNTTNGNLLLPPSCMQDRPAQQGG